MPELVSVGDVVVFNAALVDAEASIQYLACAVWKKKDAALFTQRPPPLIKREAIHQQKLDIYKLVSNKNSALDILLKWLDQDVCVCQLDVRKRLLHTGAMKSTEQKSRCS